MLTLNIRPILEARNVERPYSFLVKAGFSSLTAHNMLNNKSSSIRFEHIERLCRILICEPSDLFVWRPNKNENIPEDHPLMKLREQAMDKTIHDALSKLPYKKLKEVTKQFLYNDAVDSEDKNDLENE